jgi:hypothetical protein
MPEISEARQEFVEAADDASAPKRRAVAVLDVILFALCCLSFLIYLIESESIEYLLAHFRVLR